LRKRQTQQTTLSRHSQKSLSVVDLCSGSTSSLTFEKFFQYWAAGSAVQPRARGLWKRQDAPKRQLLPLWQEHFFLNNHYDSFILFWLLLLRYVIFTMILSIFDCYYHSYYYYYCYYCYYCHYYYYYWHSLCSAPMWRKPKPQTLKIPNS
jgi:hypothetical protein